MLRPGLWVVATPIGNLQDVSERVRYALEQAQVILAEDTRYARHLRLSLNILSVAPIYRADAYAERQKSWDKLLQDFECIALLTDAGCPGVSDSGSSIVACAHRLSKTVIPVVGPSAITALWSVAGFSATQFHFAGFFPKKLSEKIENLEALKLGVPRLYFESPHRVQATIGWLAERLPYARVCIAKELTKMHEWIFSGSLEEGYLNLTQQTLKGEWCFVVQGSLEVAAEKNTDISWQKAIDCLLMTNVSVLTASESVSKVFNIPKNTCYEYALASNPRLSTDQ